MVDTQARVTKNRTDSLEGVDEAAADGATGTLHKATGAVGAVVGMLTGGLVIAATAGFVVGIAVGIAVGRSTTPSAPPRWQVWR